MHAPRNWTAWRRWVRATAIGSMACWGFVLGADLRAQERPGGAVGASAPQEEGFFDGSGVLIWADPNRLDLLSNDFPEIKKEFVPPNDAQIMRMAQSQVQPDPALIRKYIDYHLGQLTDRSNIDSMQNKASDPRGTQAMQASAKALRAPLDVPRTARNDAFRRAYIAAMLESAPAALGGHLYTRFFFLNALTHAKAPELVPLFNEVLVDSDQAAALRLLAAIGIRDLAMTPSLSLDQRTQVFPAAESLSTLLAESREMIWPVRQRALLALGSLRAATSNPLQGRAEFAVEPFNRLADPTERPRVRAIAAWALGALNIPSRVDAFNFDLIGYEIGEAAVAVGEFVLAATADESRAQEGLAQVSLLLDPLIRLLTALEGDPSLSRSGLLRSNHPKAAAAQGRFRAVEDRIRVLTNSCYRLSTSVGNQIGPARSAVSANLKDLKSYLAANPPQSLELYPGGPTATLMSGKPEGPPAIPEGADGGEAP